MPITSTIVNVSATITTAPAPSQLQQSGAFVSCGGSTLAENTYSYYGSLAALTAALGSSGNHLELEDMATTYFAQGNTVGVYLLEIGTVVDDTAALQIARLAAWITANPEVFYAYLTPATWDAAGATLNTLAGNHSSASGKTYFFVTTTGDTIDAYVAANKAIVAVVPSPTAGGTEFQAAAFFYQWLANIPSAVSPAAPMNFRYVFGVTPWVLTNNQTDINAVLTAFGNIILTGAEGGISTATLRNGTTIDGNQMMFWYAVDWLLINAKQQLAAAIINGSNQNPPVYYNQNGINLLLAVLQNLGTSGISFGLLLNADFTAQSFASYTAANPDDYAAGIYKGFSCIATPQLGFTQITFFLDATQFALTA